MGEEKEDEDAVEILINEFADLKEYGSSEENSNEEYDEEEINDLIENILGKDVDEEEYMNDYEEEEEEEYMNDYEDMSDYDYLADVNGEYDELAMELEADDVNDPVAAFILEKDLGSDLDA